MSFGHIRYLDLVGEGHVSEHFDSTAFKFSIVRNPLDRAVSLFNYLKRMNLLPKMLSFELFTIMLRESQYENIGLFNVRGLSQCNPQMTWLVDDSGRLIADLVGHFERLDPFLNELRDRKIIDGELPQRNMPSSREDAESYYTTKTIRQNVELAYSSDFELFGY